MRTLVATALICIALGRNAHAEEVIISGAERSSPQRLGDGGVAVAYGPPGGVSVAVLKDALSGTNRISAYLEDVSLKNTGIDIGVYLISGWDYRGRLPDADDYEPGKDGVVSFKNCLGSISMLAHGTGTGRVALHSHSFTIIDSQDPHKTIRLRSALTAIARNSRNTKVTLLLVITPEHNDEKALVSIMDPADPLITFGRLRITTTKAPQSRGQQ